MLGTRGVVALFVSVWIFVFPDFAGTAIPHTGVGRDMSECPDGYYGINCRHHCHCAEKEECGRDVADCGSGCEDGWTGPTCQSRNVVFGMPAQIRTRDPEVRAKVAVDGNDSTCVTSEPDVAGWLRVGPLATTTVYHVTLLTESVSPRGWQIYVTEYSDFYWATPCATVRADGPHVQMTCDSPVTGKYLTLLNTQGAVAVCELQASVCANYSFGAGCASVCRCADVSEACHPLTGRCLSGCMPGYTGRDCQQGCQGSYGSNCATRCGHCEGGQSCDPVTGACPGLCQPGWTGVSCNAVCGAGTYGDSCRSSCGHCLDDASCDPVTGRCPERCQSGWHGPLCDQECREGTYGQSCQFKCGHCLRGTSCNSVTGICPRGCARGWEGLFCRQECLPHHYGLNCLLRCHNCLTSCDSQTGVCDYNGCRSGWMGKFCNTACSEGDFGENCQTKCGHCIANQVCHAVTGHCPEAECQPGWDGPACIDPCPQGTWGLNCSKACGSCQKNAPCDPITGRCPGACADHFSGDRCEIREVFEDSSSGEAPVTLMAVVLSVVLTVLLLVLVCLALKWRRDKYLVDL